MAVKKKKEEAKITPKKLISLRPILFEGRQFKSGERLPAYDIKIVEKWIENKSAYWEEDAAKEETKESQGQPET